MKRVLGLLAPSCLLLVGSASGDIVTPVSVTGNAAADNPVFKAAFGPSAGALDNLINGNEVTDFASNRKGFLDAEGNQLLDADFTETNVLSGDVLHDAIFSSESPLGAFVWVTDPRAGEPADFFAPPNESDPVVLTFNLGDSHTLDGMFVWRYTGGPTFANLQGNNPKSWSVEFSNDNGFTYSAPVALPDIAIVADDPGTEGMIEGTGALPADLFSFPSIDANVVRLTLPDNFSGVGAGVAGGDRVGLSEVHFKSASPGLPGDTNNDGVVSTLDIDPFVLALTDPTGYASAFPGVDVLAVADINMDSMVNTLDIDPFVALLTGSGAAAVATPEPSSLALLLIALVSSSFPFGAPFKT